MFAANSSRGRNGAMSSSGAETIVPSGSLFDAAFGPRISNGSSITSTSTGPSVAKIPGSLASSS